MMKQWLIGILALGLVPVGGVSIRRPVPLPVLVPLQPAMAMPAPPVVFKEPLPPLEQPQKQRKPEPGKPLAQVMEKELLKFVESNYPSRMNLVVRSLQSEEGPLRRDLNEAVRFLQGFTPTPGNVTIEGNWQGSGRKRCYALLSVIHGVTGSPETTISFHTYPGLFRPYTIVEVDKDGDGKPDEKSTALCKRDKMLEWLSQRFPQAVCLARKK